MGDIRLEWVATTEQVADALTHVCQVQISADEGCEGWEKPVMPGKCHDVPRDSLLPASRWVGQLIVRSGNLAKPGGPGEYCADVAATQRGKWNCADMASHSITRSRQSAFIYQQNMQGYISCMCRQV